MNGSPKTMAFFFLCLTAGSTAQPQTSSQGLPSLIKLAMQRNAEVQIQKSEAHVARLNYRQAESDFLPQLDFEAGYLEASSKQGVPDFITANASRERLAWLSVQQTLFDAGVILNINETKIDRQLQPLLSKQEDQNVTLQVIAAYFAALDARGQLKVLEENLQALDALYRQSQQLFENGVVPELDIKKSRVEFLLQQNSLARAQNDYHSALNLLKELCGLPLADSLAIDDFTQQNLILNELNHYQSVALQNRLELRLNRMEASRISAQKRNAWLQRLPQVNASLQYGWDTAATLIQDNRGWQLFLNFRLPLWHWGRAFRESQIASLRASQNEARFEQLQKQILREVIEAYQECRLQQQQLQAMAESRSEASEAVRMATFGYQEGVVTSLDVINSQKLLTDSNIQYLQALYDFYIAKARLFRSTGTLQEELTWLEQ
jgi:outer membrane protein